MSHRVLKQMFRVLVLRCDEGLTLGGVPTQWVCRPFTPKRNKYDNVEKCDVYIPLVDVLSWILHLLPGRFWDIIDDWPSNQRTTNSFSTLRKGYQYETRNYNSITQLKVTSTRLNKSSLSFFILQSSSCLSVQQIYAWGSCCFCEHNLY